MYMYMCKSLCVMCLYGKVCITIEQCLLFWKCVHPCSIKTTVVKHDTDTMIIIFN